MKWIKLIGVTALVVLTVSPEAVRADEFSARVAQLASAAADASTHINRLKQAGDTDGARQAEALRQELLARTSELQKLANDLGDARNQIEQQKSSQRFRKLEVEAAEQAYKAASMKTMRKKQADLDSGGRWAQPGVHARAQVPRGRVRPR